MQQTLKGEKKLIDTQAQRRSLVNGNEDQVYDQYERQQQGIDHRIFSNFRCIKNPTM
jgi:hypothetical protein